MKNFFGNIKWSQILAGALAAVTSFLFMNKIGIAGSVIGAAVASIVTALATQIYQDVLKASQQTMQKIAGTDEDSEDSEGSETGDGEGEGKGKGKGASERKPRAAVGVVDPYGAQMQAREAQDADLAENLEKTTVAGAGSATGIDATGVKDEDFAGFTSVTETAPTQVLPAAMRDAAVEASLDAEPSPMQQRRAISSGAGAGSEKRGSGHASGTLGESGNSGKSAKPGAKQLSPKAKMFIVALVCSLLAVLLTAVIISIATAGEGLGAKPAVVQQQTQTPYQDVPSTDDYETRTPLDDETATDDSSDDASATASASASSTDEATESPSASTSASASPSASSSASPTKEATKEPASSSSPTSDSTASASPTSSASPSAADDSTAGNDSNTTTNCSHSTSGRVDSRCA